MAAKKKLPRPTYRQHDEDEIRAAIKAAFYPGSVLMDLAWEVTQERVEARDEFERGVCEGRRRLAGDWIGIALSDAAE